MKNFFVFIIVFLFLISEPVFSQSDFFRLYSDSLSGASQLKTIPTDDGGFLWLSGGWNSFVVHKFDSVGTPMWSKEYTGSGMMNSGDVIELPNHDFILTGNYFFGNQPTYFIMRISSAGDLIQAYIDQDTSYVASYWGDVNIAGVTSDNGFVFAGRIRVDSLQLGNLPFISKIDSSGNCNWFTYFQVDTGTYCEKIRSLEDENENIIVTGCYRYGANYRTYFFIAKFDSSGNLLWLKHGFQSSKMNGMVINATELNSSYYVLTMQDTPTFNFNVPHIYKISGLTGDLIWHMQYDFWLGWEENKIYKYNDGRLLFTCRDAFSGSSMNVEIDTTGLILHSVKYADGGGLYYLHIKNTIELNSGKGVISGFAGDWNGAWGIILASVDSTYNTSCKSSDISLPIPVYYLDSMITKTHTVYSATASLTDVTVNIQTNTRTLSYLDFCDLLNTHELNPQKELIIYPNPATNQFAVDSKQLTNGQLEIFNSLGEKIYFSEIHGQTTVDCQLFPRGIYFVRLSNSEKYFVQRLIIE